MEAVVRKVMEEYEVEIGYHVGTMIEIPRGALTADEIAEHAEFFSFGTNDLTETVYGISRDDAGKFFSLCDKQDMGARSFCPARSEGGGRPYGDRR